jgi:HEAT repeat protein
MLGGDEWPAFFAASALAEIGDPSAIPALMRVVRQGTPAGACAAIDAVGRLDHEGASLRVIAEQAEHPDRAVRWTVVRAVVAMAALRGPAAWSQLDRARWVELVGEATRSEDRATRLAGIRGLGLLGDRRGTRPILSAYRAMKDCSEEEQDLVVRALVETGESDVLIKAVELDEDRVTDVAIDAVRHLRCREALAALGAIRRKSWDWRRRKAALGAMAQIGTDEALSLVCEGVDDATGYVRAEAVRLVSESGRVGYVRRLLAKLQSERYEDVRLEMAKALLRAGTHEVMIELVDMLRYGPAPVRETAAWAIGTVRLPEGLDPLMKTFNDSEWKVRRAVIEGLANYQDEGALRTLLIALTDDHEKVRLAATSGIALWDRPESRRALLNVAQHDPDVWVRRRAIECLGEARLSEAVPVLGAVAADPSAPRLLRRAAADALTRIGGEAATAALAAAKLDREPDGVRPAA